MDFVYSSSSPPSFETDGAATNLKRAGRRCKTRHPFYRGVRQKNVGKWVSEVREPNKKSRIWLGTFPNPEMAAVAHDVAALALHGAAAPLNFPDSAHRHPPPASSSHQDIQRAALQAAREFTSAVFADSSSTSSSLNGNDDWRKINVETSTSSGGVEWMDEEAIYNMPLVLDSMAEGMLLTPPAMKKGFYWSPDIADDDDDDLSLWGN